VNGARLLVTGASGFTGRHLVSAASERGIECIALSHSRQEVAQGATRQLVADLSNAEELAAAVRSAAPDFLIHLAAVSFVAHGDIGEIYRTNVEGTVNLLTAVASAKPDITRIIVASSANVYGNADKLPITEATPARPVNHYANSKLAMESACKFFIDLPLTITRPFNYTGLGQPEHFIVPKVVAAFRDKRESINLGNTSVERDFSDVRDVVQWYLKLLEADTGTYNLCSGQARSIDSIIAYLTEKSGHQLAIHVDSGLLRSAEIQKSYGSPAKLHQAIGPYDHLEFSRTLDWMLGV